MQEVSIYGVSFDMVGKQPIVLLKTLDGNKFLPIWIGHPEAAAILMKLQGAPTPRPMTHDLVDRHAGRAERTGRRRSRSPSCARTRSTPSITLQVNGSEIEIDSRPSDALALAVRTERADLRRRPGDRRLGASSSAREPEDAGEVVDEFKKFLENVNPEDFGN